MSDLELAAFDFHAKKGESQKQEGEPVGEYKFQQYAIPYGATDYQEVVETIQSYNKRQLISAKEDSILRRPQKRDFSKSNAAFNNYKCWGDFRDYLGLNPAIVPLEQNRADEGSLVTLSDSTSGAIEGFSIALLKKRNRTATVDDFYVTVNQDRKFQGEGLGLRLAVLQMLALSKKGITAFETDIWPKSYRMFEKSGIPFKKIKDLDGDKSRLRIELSYKRVEEINKGLSQK